MKRIICFLLILCILPVCALSDDLRTTVLGHNMYTSVCNAKEITVTPTQEKKGESVYYTYKLTDNIRVHFISDGEEIKSCGCVLLDESETAEFLAQCVTACYNFGGIADGTNCYDQILYQFLQARSENGIDIGNAVLQSIIFKMEKNKNNYIFFVTRY